MVRTSLKTGEHNHFELSQEDRRSTLGIWICRMEKPFSIHLSVARQIDLIYQNAIMADCNNAMAHMYGFDKSSDLKGIRLIEMLPANNENIEYLSAVIMNGYIIENARSKEIDNEGKTKYFLNTLECFIENEMVTGAMGWQQETEKPL